MSAEVESPVTDEIVADRLQPYRQPMVTGTGIILGFVLNFAGAFVKSDSAGPYWIAYVVFALLIAGVVTMLIALGRILRLGVPASDSIQWYQRTRQLFMIGVSCAVSGALLDMFSNFLAN